MPRGNSKLSDDDKKIINMAEARKRQQTLRKGAGADKKSLNGSGAVKSRWTIAGFSFLAWVQFAMFLVVLSIAMRYCRAG